MNIPRAFFFQFSLNFSELGQEQSIPISDGQAAMLWDSMPASDWKRQIHVNGVAWVDLSLNDQDSLTLALQKLASVFDQSSLIKQRAGIAPESVGEIYEPEIPF